MDCRYYSFHLAWFLAWSHNFGSSACLRRPSEWTQRRPEIDPKRITMNINPTHVHLLLNHFPTIAFAVALGLLLFAAVRNSDELKHASLVILFLLAVVAIPTYITGNAASAAIANTEGVSEAKIRAHESAALIGFIFIEITGFIAWLGLWQARLIKGFGNWCVCGIHSKPHRRSALRSPDQLRARYLPAFESVSIAWAAVLPDVPFRQNSRIIRFGPDTARLIQWFSGIVADVSALTKVRPRILKPKSCPPSRNVQLSPGRDRRRRR